MHLLVYTKSLMYIIIWVRNGLHAECTNKAFSGTYLIDYFLDIHKRVVFHIVCIFGDKSNGGVNIIDLEDSRSSSLGNITDIGCSIWKKYLCLGPDVYKVSRQAKQLVDSSTQGYINEFRKVNAPTAAVANRLSEIHDVHFPTRDVINRVNKIRLAFDSDKQNIAVFFQGIKEGGGQVLAKYHPGKKWHSDCFQVSDCLKLLM